MRRQLISAALAVLLLLSVLPFSASADSSAVRLQIPSRYTLSGQTSFELTDSEYSALKEEISAYIRKCLNSLSGRYAHYESISANDDFTVFTVVVNSPELDQIELDAEDLIFDYGFMYDAYNCKSIRNVRIDYCDTQGELLFSRNSEDKNGDWILYSEPENIQDIQAAGNGAGTMGSSSTAELPQDRTPSVVLHVEPAYSIDGETDYALSEAEYDSLLRQVREYITGELNKCTRSAGKNYYHIDSIKADQNFVSYVITLNDALNRTAEERAVPDQILHFAEMYAYYSMRKLGPVYIQYKSQKGEQLHTTLLKSSLADLARPDPPKHEVSHTYVATPEMESYLSQSMAAWSALWIPSMSSTAAMVWLSETGDKYHSNPDCGFMDRYKAIQIPLEQAKLKGIEPCDKCW